jgi:hypothetical protein
MKELTQILIIVVGLVLLAVFVWLIYRSSTREQFGLEVSTKGELVTPVSLGTTPTITITTGVQVSTPGPFQLVTRDQSVSERLNHLNNTGLTKTSEVLVLVHSNTFIPGDHFLPTSYASPGLVEFAQFGSPKGLIEELEGWYGPEVFKEMLVLPSLSLMGHSSSLGIHPDTEYNLVTVLVKVSPSQSLFATGTANTQLGEQIVSLMVYDANTTREKYPSNQPLQSATAYYRISAHTYKGQLLSIGEISIA